MKVRPSVVIVENNCVLLMRYRYGQTDVYNLPGGNVDNGRKDDFDGRSANACP